MLQDKRSPDLRNLTSVFFAIHLAGGHIGLPIIAITFAFSKTSKRHPTVINFCVTWILYSIIYCLLIYGGDTVLNDPPYGLCLTQAAMQYAAPPMVAVAGFQLVFQIWSTFIESWEDARLAVFPHWLKLTAIIAPPYLTFLGFAVSAAYEGWRNPQWVQVKTGLYCGLMHGRFEMFVVPIFCSILLTLIIAFEVATVVRIIRGRQVIRKHFPLANPQKTPCSPAVRAALFLVYAALSLGTCMIDMGQGGNTFGYMVQATLPLAAFIIFGLSKDVLLTWRGQRKWEPQDPASNGSAYAYSHSVARPLSFASTCSPTTVDSATRPSDSVV